MKWKLGEKFSAWLGLAVIAAAGFALRCTQLEARPMHTDEAVHAVILGEMLESGTYRYNPHDAHGPTLYYLSWPLLRLAGVHDLAEMEAWQLRAISAVIGAATILLLALWAEDFGVGAVMMSGALMALAAPFVYYQRYFIHEGLYLLLTLAWLRCVWAWFEDRDSIRLTVITSGVTALLVATKETAPLIFVAAGLAALGAWLTTKSSISLPVILSEVEGSVPPLREGATGLILRQAQDDRFQLRRPSPKILLTGIFSFAIVFLLLYSSFGADLGGPSDFITAQFRFAHRAGGEGHEKPWWTYLVWLFAPNLCTVPWSGWIVTVLAGGAASFRWQQPLVRFLLFYTLAVALIYSLIPYKTPWLELNILAPASLLAGVGASAWWNATGKFRPALVLLALLCLTALALETERTCFAHALDVRNPLAYSPTVPDVAQLAARVTQIRANDPASVIAVVSTDYWPLPWYLRKLPQVGYWNEVPPTITGDILITSPDLLPALQAKIGPGWNIEYFGLRPEVLAIVLSKPKHP